MLSSMPPTSPRALVMTAAVLLCPAEIAAVVRIASLLLGCVAMCGGRFAGWMAAVAAMASAGATPGVFMRTAAAPGRRCNNGGNVTDADRSAFDLGVTAFRRGAVVVVMIHATAWAIGVAMESSVEAATTQLVEAVIGLSIVLVVAEAVATWWALCQFVGGGSAAAGTTLPPAPSWHTDQLSSTASPRGLWPPKATARMWWRAPRPLAATAHITTECPICLERLPTADEAAADNGAIALFCGHVFHGACVQRWMATTMSCPLCRGTTCGEREPASRSTLG